METALKLRWSEENSWLPALASLLPHWLVALALTTLGVPALWLALAVAILLVVKGWTYFDLLLYAVFPIIFLMMFESISWSYRTPFLLLCAVILSFGILAAQRSDFVTRRWLILLGVAVLTFTLASHAAGNYWGMIDNLGLVNCYSGGSGCEPLPVNATPPWVLFFGL